MSMRLVTGLVMVGSLLASANAYGFDWPWFNHHRIAHHHHHSHAASETPAVPVERPINDEPELDCEKIKSAVAALPPSNLKRDLAALSREDRVAVARCTGK